MAYDYEIRGFDELAKKFGAAAEQVTPRTRRMVRAGAQVFKRAVVERAPVLDQKTAGSTSLEPGALKADIRVAMLKDETLPTALVGPSKKTAYVANFVEYGHRGMRGKKVFGDVDAHSFIRPAFEAAQGDAEAAMVADFDKPIEGLS